MANKRRRVNVSEEDEEDDEEMKADASQAAEEEVEIIEVSEHALNKQIAADSERRRNQIAELMKKGQSEAQAKRTVANLNSPNGK